MGSLVTLGAATDWRTVLNTHAAATNKILVMISFHGIYIAEWQAAWQFRPYEQGVPFGGAARHFTCLTRRDLRLLKAFPSVGVGRYMNRTCPRFRATALVGALLLLAVCGVRAPAAGLDAVVQAENFLKQEGGQGVAKVPTAFGGKVQGYEFGRRAGHWAEYRLELPRPLKKACLLVRYGRQYKDPARWDLVLDARARKAALTFPTTGSWFEYHWVRLPVGPLDKGPHTLRIVSAHQDANVVFDVLALAEEGVDPERAMPFGPPAGDQARAKLASLKRAVEHLAREFPREFDFDGSIRRELGELEKVLPADAGTAVPELAGRLAALSRRALLEANPLMRFERLLFTRRHPVGGQHYAYTEALSWNQDRPRFFRPGSSLCVLSPPRPDGKLEVLLDSPTGVVRDPDVHYDGRRVLFAHKKSLDGDDYHLYEMDAATRQVRALTAEPGFADYEGCYLPDGNIAFNSTRCVQTVDCFPVSASNLYLMDGDGRNVRRLSINPVHDNFPTVLNDGRLLFTRWEYNDRWVIHVQGLAMMNPDGTAYAACYGNNSYWPISMLHARAVPGSGRIVATLSGHHDVDQCGEIGLFDTALGSEEAAGCVHLWPPRDIAATQDEFYWRKLDAVYQYPWPLSEEFFLVACRPKGRPHFGIYLVDVFGNHELIHEDASISCSSPMPLAPRARPPVIPSRVRHEQTRATVYLADVYAGRAFAGIQRGAVKSLRVIEILNRPTGTRHWSGMDGTPSMGLCSSWDVKRVVGTVPVEADGSAYFSVPAMAAIYFQPLDDKGRALQWMRSWTTLMPGETTGCVGCHESSRDAPPVRLPSATARPPGELAPLAPLAGAPPRPAGDAERGFSFPHDVQPVLDRHCVRCHNHDHPKGIDLRSDKTDGFSLAYEHLRLRLKIAGTRSQPPMVAAKTYGAIASGLIGMLERGHHDVKLPPADWDRLVTWVDINAPYYGTYLLTRYHANFGRCAVSDYKPLWAALNDTCSSCHRVQGDLPGVPEEVFHEKIDRKKYGFTWAGKDRYNTRNAVLVNLTHPEQSRLLRAPLAKSAGGLGLCSKSVFADTADPHYQAALAVLQKWTADLAAQPREDMIGAKPCPEYTIWRTKRDESDAIERRSREALGRQP